MRSAPDQGALGESHMDDEKILSRNPRPVQTRVLIYRDGNVAALFCPTCLSYDIAEGKPDFKRLTCHSCGAWWAPWQSPGVEYDGISEVTVECTCSEPEAVEEEAVN
jgi:hypothetical protein